MKKLTGLFIIVLALHPHAFGQCNGMEAQFMGKITKLKKSAGTCSAVIDFSYFESSVLCPLDISDTVGRSVELRDCKSQIGDQVSGILIDASQKLFIE